MRVMAGDRAANQRRDGMTKRSEFVGSFEAVQVKIRHPDIGIIENRQCDLFG